MKYHYNHLLAKHGFEIVQANRLFTSFLKMTSNHSVLAIVTKDSHNKGEKIAFNIQKHYEDKNIDPQLLSHQYKYLKKEVKILTQEFDKMKA